VQVLDDLPLPGRRCLQLAHDALLAGLLPVGAVLAMEPGAIAGEGHNEVGGGTSALAGTPLAHAEMVAISRADPSTFRDLTLWSSVQPCVMCAGAGRFLGVRGVVHLAADPSAPLQLEPPTAGSGRLGHDLAARVATLLFLLGASERVLAHAEDRDAVELVRSGRADVLRGPSLEDAAAALARTDRS
jgi:tRNA(Arg) A34 adenosine deaminase TadA